MEDFVLERVAVILAAVLAGQAVRAVRQPEEGELLVEMSPLTLDIHLQRATSSALYLLPKPPREKSLADSFGQKATAALRGQHLSALEKRHCDRVLRFSFSSGAQLVLELIPVSANAFLLDVQGRITAARFDDLVGARRQAEGDLYQYPPSPARLSWDAAATGDFEFRSEEQLIERVEGFGPVLAREVWARCGGSQARLGAVLKGLEQDLRQSDRWYFYLSARADLDDFGSFDFYRDCLLVPIRLQSHAEELAREFADFQEASSFLHPLARAWKQFQARRSELQRELERDQKKQTRLHENLRLQLEEAERAATFMRYGELLKIESAAWKQRDLPEAIEAVDLFQPEQPVISILLPRRESLRDNIEFYFQKAKRLERSRAAVQTKMRRVEADIASLNERLQKLSRARRLGDLPDVKEKQSRRAAPEPKARPYRRYISSDGLTILVGKNNRENDELTFREARSQDFWFHAADYPGSHVVVKLERRGEILPKTLREAAQLAAYYSKAKNLKKAAVHYTRKKNVFKMKKAAPGVVRLTEFKTIMVEPARKVGERES